MSYFTECAEIKEMIEINCESMHLNETNAIVNEIENMKQKYENIMNECNYENNPKFQSYNEIKKKRMFKENEFKNIKYPELCDYISKENQIIIECNEINQKYQKNQFLFNHILNLQKMGDHILDGFGEFEENMNKLIKTINDKLNNKWQIFEKNWQTWNISQLCAWMAFTTNTANIAKQQWQDLTQSYFFAFFFNIFIFCFQPCVFSFHFFLYVFLFFICILVCTLFVVLFLFLCVCVCVCVCVSVFFLHLICVFQTQKNNKR